MTLQPFPALLEWLAGRPEAARVAVALDPDRLLCEAGLLGWSTLPDTAGRSWKVVSYQGDELAFRLRFRKAAEHERRLIVLTRGEGNCAAIDVSTLADVLACNEGGPPLDMSLPSYFRRLCPKISFPPHELRRHKAALLAQVSAIPQAAGKIVQRWGRPDDWGRGQVAALVMLACHPDLHLSELWPDQTQPAPFLAHALRALFSHAQTPADRGLLVEMIREAAPPQVREHLFWLDIAPEELAGYLILRCFAAEEGLQNPSTQLAGVGLFGAETPLDRFEPLALAVTEAVRQDSEAWSALEAQAEVFLSPRRLQKVMGLLPPAGAPLSSALAAVGRPGIAPVLLMHYLRELLLVFFKQDAAGCGDWTAALEQHPLLSQTAEAASPMRQACRAALQVLITADRVEQRLARPMPDFSHPEALLDWYVQSGQHILELDVARALHWLERVGDDAVVQAGQQYLFGSGDELAPTPASLKGRVRQRLEVLDCRLANFVRPDAEAFSRRPQSVLRLLKEHLAPLVGSLDADGSAGRVWILVFDGMRYDTWEAVVLPLFAESFRVEESKPRFAVLPGSTEVARTSLLAGCLPGEWSGYKGTPTRDESTLAARCLGLSQQDSKTKLRLVTQADTTRARRSLGPGDKDAAAVNILIYPIADDCHEYRRDLAAFNSKIHRDIVGDPVQGVRGILDGLLGRIRPEDTVLATSDHGFLELLAGDAVAVSEADILAGGRNPHEDVHHRYARGFQPPHPCEPVTVPALPHDYKVAVGPAWWRRGGERKSPRYDHGGLSLAEMVVPGALLHRVTEKEARAELNELPPLLHVSENETVELAAVVVNTGNVPVSFEVLPQTNLGEDLGAWQGQLAPGGSATHKWTVKGRYGQGHSQEMDRKATLTAISLRLRHTDLQGQWREAREGPQTVAVKVKPHKTKLDTDALRGFDDI